MTNTTTTPEVEQAKAALAAGAARVSIEPIHTGQPALDNAPPWLRSLMQLAERAVDSAIVADEMAFEATSMQIDRPDSDWTVEQVATMVAMHANVATAIDAAVRAQSTVIDLIGGYREHVRMVNDLASAGRAPTAAEIINLRAKLATDRERQVFDAAVEAGTVRVVTEAEADEPVVVTTGAYL